MKNRKSNFGFLIYKIWQILKHFAGTFRPAQTLKLGGVYIHIFSSLPKAQKTYVFEHILVCVTYCIDENRHSKQDIWPCINNLSSALTNVYYICNILHTHYMYHMYSHVYAVPKKEKEIGQTPPLPYDKKDLGHLPCINGYTEQFKFFN